MKLKEINKKFMIVSNWKNPLVTWFTQKIFQRYEGWRIDVNHMAGLK